MEPHFLTMKPVWYSLWSTSMIHGRRTQDDQGLRAKTLTGIYEVVACAGVDRHFTPRVSQHHARGWTRTSQTKMTDPWSRVRVQQLTLYLLCCRSKVSTKKLTRGSPWYWNCVVYLVQVEHYLTHLLLERFSFGSLVHEHTLHGDINFSTWTTCIINKYPD